MTAARAYDVLFAADLRHPDAPGASRAAEVRSMVAAGYRTAMVDAGWRGATERLPVHPDVAACVYGDIADLAPSGQPVSGRTLVLRERAAAAELSWALGLDVGSVVVVGDGDPDESRGLERRFRAPVRSAPDWPEPVVDTAAWACDRRSFVSDRPVVGLVESGDIGERAEDALPWLLDPGFTIRFRGSRSAASRLLGSEAPPGHWELRPPGAETARQFLCGVDFLVQPAAGPSLERDTEWLLWAAAAGALAITARGGADAPAEEWEAASPAQVGERIRALYADPTGSLVEAARRGRLVEERHGFSNHAAVMRERVAPAPRTAARPIAAPRTRKRVAFFTSNGIGMGHVTRLMACARRLPDDLEPVFITLSLALAAVQRQGYLCEYIPRTSEWKAPRWNPFLESRLIELVNQYEPRALVFDGAFPYLGLVRAKDRLQLPLIWMRRAMWKEGVNQLGMDRGRIFDLVIEPGERAEGNDRGLTVSQGDHAVRVAPITLLDSADQLSREEARAELRLDPERTSVLLMLGSYRTDETDSFSSLALERLLAWADVEIVLPGSMLPETRKALPDNVKDVSIYPLSRHFRAFDFALSGAGYNAFHELLGAGVPTIFVPQTTKTDDQAARARYAAEAGLGLSLHPFSVDRLDDMLAIVRDTGRRDGMRARMAALPAGNGAVEAAETIRSVVEDGLEVVMASRAGTPRTDAKVRRP